MLRIRKNRILIELDKAADKTDSGLLWLPDGEEKPPAQTGLVVAIGPDQFEIEVGQRIAFSRYAGVELHTKEKKRQIILDQSEVLGILTLDDNEGQKSTRLVIAIDGKDFLASVLSRENQPASNQGDMIVQCYYNHRAATVYLMIDRYTAFENKPKEAGNAGE